VAVGAAVRAGRLGTGVLNALLGREAIASVPPDRAAMGSGANNTARYLGAACGITLFVTVATHAGDDLFAGWNAAALVTVALTLLGAAAIALTGRRAPRPGRHQPADLRVRAWWARSTRVIAQEFLWNYGGLMRQSTSVRATVEQVAASGHPVRRRLLEVLGVDGPATASQLAERTDQLVGNVSHHLKMLARAGLIEEAPELAKDRRERWWRRIPLSLSWSLADVRGDAVGEAVAIAAEHENLGAPRRRRPGLGGGARHRARAVRRAVDAGRVRDRRVGLGDARGAARARRGGEPGGRGVRRDAPRAGGRPGELLRLRPRVPRRP
jgi:DNA-binding transcriptional ArsR family regulator